MACQGQRWANASQDANAANRNEFNPVVWFLVQDRRFLVAIIIRAAQRTR